MKKLLILTLTLLLPLAVFAVGNQGSKGQQNLQRRNEQTIRHLQALGRQYNRADKAETKEQVSKKIDTIFEHWYMENEPKLIAIQQQEIAETQESQKANVKENMVKPAENGMLEPIQQSVENSQPEEPKEPAQIKTGETLKQEMLAEIKAGKLPELMLKTVSEQFALQIKQQEEAKTKKQNKNQKAGKQKSKGFKLFKK